MNGRDRGSVRAVDPSRAALLRGHLRVTEKARGARRTSVAIYHTPKRGRRARDTGKGYFLSFIYASITGRAWRKQSTPQGMPQ